ncbi:MAG: DUF4350 domain-containing protein [Armatimonadota bacterium]
MKNRFSKDAWVLLVLFVFLIAIGFFSSARQKASGGIDVIPKRTTYSSRPAGMKALYETLDGLGYPVTRHLAPLTVLPKDGTYILASPEVPLSDDEWASLQQWTERGNLLIVASGLEVEEFNGTAKIDTSRSIPGYPSFLTPNVNTFRVPKHSAISDDQWDFKSYSSIESRISTPTGVMKPEKKRKPSPDAKTLAPLFGYANGNTVAFCKWGRGSVIVLSSSWPLCNKGIRMDDNLILVLNALSYRDPSNKLAVTFDEFHHGYGRAPGLMSLIGTSARIGLAQILMAFLLLIFAVSRRFGRPVPLREGGRQRNEYLTSMASLLKRAHATNIVKQEIERKYLEDIALILGLPPVAEPDLILSAAIEKRPDMAQELHKLLGERSSSPDEAFDESVLLSLAVKWHKLRKELMNKR